MNGSAKSSNVRAKDWSGPGLVYGKMNASVTVYSRANVPKVATVFSKRYSGRILYMTWSVAATYCHGECRAYLFVRGYSSS